MAKYLVVARSTGTPSTLSPQEMQRVIQKYMSWAEELRKSGRAANGEKLRAGDGRVLRGEGGKMAVTDGPYAETKEQMGGFWIIEAADLDAALDWAGKAAAACEGPVEVRPAEGG